MRRFAFAACVAAILIGVLLVDPRDGLGCHGKCRSSGPTTALLGSPMAIPGTLFGSPLPAGTLLGPGGDGTTNELLGGALLTADGERKLYLIRITIDPGKQSDSYVDPGETDIFYVESGTLEFDVEGAATGNGKVRIEAGHALFLDRQAAPVSITYSNVGTGSAVVLISAAPAAGSVEATPPA